MEKAENGILILPVTTCGQIPTWKLHQVDIVRCFNLKCFYFYEISCQGNFLSQFSLKTWMKHDWTLSRRGTKIWALLG